jgi:hypothetical protein
MLFRPQPTADAQTDPHDIIVAQLRDLVPRIKNGEPQVEEASPTASPSIEESSAPAAPSNDNADAFRNITPRARFHRGIFVVLLAICTGVAAAMAWHSYREQVTQRLSHLIPQFLMQTPAAEEQDTAPQAAVSQSTAEAEPTQKAATVTPEPSTPSSSTEPAPTPTQAPPTQATALPPETVQSLNTMASDISALKQAVDELRTSEQELRREIAKATEREAHPKPVQHPAKSSTPRRQRTSPQASIPHRPSPIASPLRATERRIRPQEQMQHDAYIPPQAPTPSRPPPQSGDDSVPRPPMPLQ